MGHDSRRSVVPRATSCRRKGRPCLDHSCPAGCVKTPRVIIERHFAHDADDTIRFETKAYVGRNLWAARAGAAVAHIAVQQFVANVGSVGRPPRRQHDQPFVRQAAGECRANDDRGNIRRRIVACGRRPGGSMVTRVEARSPTRRFPVRACMEAEKPQDGRRHNNKCEKRQPKPKSRITKRPAC